MAGKAPCIPARHGQRRTKAFLGLRERLLAEQAGRKAKQITRLMRRVLPAKTTKGPGRPGLSSLTGPDPAYHLDRAVHHKKPFFETASKSRDEDVLRARKLQSAELNPRDRSRARRLASTLLRGVAHNQPPASLASSLYLRELRLRVIGALWQLHNELRRLPRVVFTIIPRDFSLTPDELQRFDIRRAKEALRGDLKRAGAGRAGGCLVLFLHGEFNANTGRYQLHWHGWACGEMIQVLQRLRKQRKYQSTRAARVGDTDGVTNRVVISRKPIRNAAWRLSYRLQSFWPGRRTGDLAELKAGKQGRYRVRAKHRIDEPYHSLCLLWLDQWRIEDISLLVGMSVVGDRLQLNNAKVASTNRAL